MATSIFTDKSSSPNETDLASSLGSVYTLWQQVLQGMEESYPPLTKQWKFYSQKSGWTLVVKHKKRTILYCSPNAAFFTVTYVYGERAVEAACQADLPVEILQRIENATPYVEGRSFPVRIESEEDVVLVERLAVIKMTT